MRISTASALCITTLALWISPAFAQARLRDEGQFTFGTQPSYFGGKFGTSSTIDIFDESTFAEFKNQDIRIKLTVPYLSVSGLPNGALLSGGAVVSRGNASKGGRTATGSAATTVLPAGVHDASGIGDVELMGEYTIYHGDGLIPSIAPYTRVAFGTASARDGLGTGKNNYEFGIGLTDVVGTDLFPVAHLGYRLVSSPVGQVLNDVLTFDAGASYAVTSNNIVTVLLSGSQSQQSGYTGPADLIFAYNYNFNASGSGIQLFLDKGLTNGSAAIGAGVGVQFVL